MMIPFTIRLKWIHWKHTVKDWLIARLSSV